MGHRLPSPSPFYSFKGFQIEEQAFLRDICDEIGTLGDLYSVAASIGFPHSWVDQFMTLFPQNFPKVVFTTLAAWYTVSMDTFYAKLDALEKAFKDAHKGAVFNRISCSHSQAFKAVCSLSRLHHPDEDVMDESLGKVVTNAVDMIPNTYLRLVRTLLRELLTSKDLLTVAAACRVNPMLVVAVTEMPLRPLAKATRIFLPWFAEDAFPLKDKYLWLKFGFQCASLLAIFGNILEDFRPEIIDITLPPADEHLFKLTFTPTICVSAEDSRQLLNEWEFTFLTILCNAIYDIRKIATVVPSLKVPTTILNDAARVHGLASEQNALTTHILFKWWCTAKMTLTEKLTHLQCAFTGNGLGLVYYSALRSYGHFLYHFSPSTSERTPPPSPTIPPAAPAGRGEGVGVVMERNFLVGPQVPTQVVLHQIAQERNPDSIADVPSVDSGIVDDAPPQTPTTIAIAHPEMVRILSAPPLTTPTKTTPTKKNPFVKLIRL